MECCGFHRSWTKKTCGDQRHRFYVDDTLLTLAALRQGMGLAYLPCFMGDGESELERYRDPDPQHDLGLWLLFHTDLKAIARVLAFRDHMIGEIAKQRALFAGGC